jgi:hypothetical protein
VQSLVDEGRLSPEEADAHPQHATLVRAITGGGAHQPDLSMHDAMAGDRYLLCSNGLTQVVSTESTRAVLRRRSSPDDAVEELIALAHEGGAPDNIAWVGAEVGDAVNLGTYVVDRRPLTIPAFRRLWMASAVSAVGGSFSLIAVPTQLFTLTGSSAVVGVSAAVSMCALIISALWSGALADAMDRRRLLLAGNAGLGLAYVGLWLNGVLGLNSVPVLLVLVAIQGISFGATMTTMGAAVPRVVPTEQLVAANSLSSLTRYTGAVVGPLLAGVLIPAIGLGTLYLLDALALSVVLWAVAKLPAMPSPAGAQTIRMTGTLLQLGDGFRYLARHRVLVAILAVDLAAMVFALPVALSRSWPSVRTAVRPAAAWSLACCSRHTRPACSSPGYCQERSAERGAMARSWHPPRWPGVAVWCCSAWPRTSGSRWWRWSRAVPSTSY